MRVFKKKKQSLLIALIFKTNKFRYKYLNHSSFLKMLQHYAGIHARKTKGSCKERQLHAMGEYTYTFFTKGFEKQSLEIWNKLKKLIITTNASAKNINSEFIILLSPISLQLIQHKKNNKLNYDLSCATINPHNYFIDFLNKNNIKYVDPLDLFLKHEKKNNISLFHSYDTNHPNKEGHQIIANSIYEKIFSKN